MAKDQSNYRKTPRTPSATTGSGSGARYGKPSGAGSYGKGGSGGYKGPRTGGYKGSGGPRRPSEGGYRSAPGGDRANTADGEKPRPYGYKPYGRSDGRSSQEGKGGYRRNEGEQKPRFRSGEAGQGRYHGKDDGEKRRFRSGEAGQGGYRRSDGEEKPRFRSDDGEKGGFRRNDGEGKPRFRSAQGGKGGPYARRDNRPGYAGPGENRRDRDGKYAFKDQSERSPEKAHPEDRAELETRQEEGIFTLEGKNAVWEALKSGKHLDKLLLAQGMDESGIQPLIAVAARSQTRIERVPKAVLDRYSLRGKHQGILAFLPAMEYAPLEETLSAALEADPNALFVLLDEVQDPHNVGAIVRSAYCAGAAAVLVPQHRTSGMTATVAKASAGAISHIPVCRVTNLVRLIENLQEKGVRVLGADMEGEDCFKANLTGPLALVIGNEGEGLRRLVKESCDGSVAIPLKGEIDSLNASVAAGILLFEAVRQRSL